MPEDSPEGQEKKIDAGWKEQARAEKERLEREAAGAEPTGAAEPEEAAGEAFAADEDDLEGLGGLPDPSFLSLLMGLAAQASVYLGLAPNPITGKEERDLAAAKHVVDTVAMLKEKTEGNLDENEAGYLDDLLYTLRMEYVRRAKA